MPLVSSMIPLKKPKAISYGSPEITRKLANLVKISRLDKIDIITENNTTNPPMDTIVEMDFLIASPRISPKSDTRINSLLSEL